jgi:plasmid stabilization system protein ParE
MTFRVHLTGAAREDVRGILRWINERSPAGAQAWFRRWREALKALRHRADELALAPESEGHDEAIRQFIFRTRRGRPYRALFVVRGNTVFVLHVRGPGQDLLRPDELA